jgi:GT2 family glycosyltransferase
VGLVVVTHNSRGTIGGLLDGLPAALDGLTAEVVVVDSGSDDDTVAICRARNDCRVIESPNIGYAAGVNRGVAELSPKLPVLVLNPDVRLGERSVLLLLQRLQDGGTGIVAPRIYDGDGALTFSLRREPSLLRALGLGFTGHPLLSEEITDPAAYESPRVVSWATGAVLLVARDCHEALGGWDPTYFLYSEETDFSLRAREHGWSTVYEPRAVAIHIGAQSGWNDRLYAMQIVNRVRVFSRRHRDLTAWAYFGLSVLRELRLAAMGRSEARVALGALLLPRRRPVEVSCASGLLPR